LSEYAYKLKGLQRLKGTASLNTFDRIIHRTPHGIGSVELLTVFNESLLSIG
jgi:hypothetical protein